MEVPFHINPIVLNYTAWVLYLLPFNVFSVQEDGGVTDRRIHV